ncbi:MAG: hypothetical protein JSW58_06565 [Candidatus Latescibacterota bacterium]|nr:MAG: hypothetical protein JSW58_06565 [Candidatus Latescibacterota bacterium]
MADQVRKVTYCNTTVANRAAQGVKVLAELKKVGVNLTAFSGFPTRGGKAQLDFVTEDIAAVRKVFKENGWRLSKSKKGFLIHGKDGVGVAFKHIKKLADQKINITAADAVYAGKGRFGMILWVKPKDYRRAARALNAK